jgi:Ca2+-binding EF-hand superfamily protein
VATPLTRFRVGSARSILRTVFTALTDEQIDDLFERVDVKGYDAITYGAFPSTCSTFPSALI